MSQPGVMLLHHFGGSARAWDPVLGRLGDLETLAIDLPGFGAEAGATGPFDVAGYADAAAAALATMQSHRIIVVGHSMGGKVVLALAARCPERVAGLLLLSPSPPTPEPMTEADRAAALAGWGKLDHAEATLSRITASPLGARARDLALDDILRTSAAAWRAWLESGSREDIASGMTRIALPVLVLCGSEDAAIPVAVHERELMPRLGNAVLRTVPGAGHLLPIEAAEVVAAAITELLAMRCFDDLSAAAL